MVLDFFYIIARRIKEVIWVRKTSPITNRDEGGTDSATYWTAGFSCHRSSRGRAKSHNSFPEEDNQWY